ncbi:class I SAM-dependent methyltransferase [Citrifermentans bremense]|uniref:class I SAM-dependent methyltransferase n=1 Tax=Citrifermentans bremense TaxID=60035 RepID=UPI0006861907|nr:class I SAM-dependent methyltransferase [Citrifermentans bremense]
MKEKSVPTETDWTLDSIRRFWNYHGQKPQVDSEYFSFQVGDALLNLLRRGSAFSKQWTVLDFGCGPGFLLERFLAVGNKCYGFDFSNGTVDRVNSKFSTHPNWSGAVSSSSLPISYDQNFFDLVTCMETLEHLLDDMLPATLNEIHRLLKPHGIAFFTTPANEELSASHVYCPFCDHEFHKIQHVRSFTQKDISDLLSAHGFKVIYCEAIDLFELQKNKKVTKHNVARSVKYYMNRFLDVVNPIAAQDPRYRVPRCSTGPNLCVVAEKV